MTTAAVPIPSRTPASPRRGGKLARIAIATINRAEGDTGVHTHTRVLSEGLREAGLGCDVVSAFSGSTKWMPIFAVRPLLLQRVNKTWSTLWHRHWHMAALKENLAAYVAANQPDVVLAQCPVSARAALDVRAESGGDFTVVMVCHFNHSEAAEYRGKGELTGEEQYDAMLQFEDRVVEAVDRVIYVSQWARDSVEQSRGLHTRGSTVIWNGLADVAPGTPITRAELDLRDEDVVLMNVGSLEPRKNQVGLLRLFADINAQYPAARLVLVGEGPQRAEIERRIAELKLNDAVRLLGHRRDVPALLPLADVYMHFATLENCPLALIEAARAGLPFAAVPAGGVPELQAALDCRIDIAPHDTRQSIEHLRPLLSDPALRREQGRRARERFVATFTRAAMVRAYVEAMKS